jgi:hypothetical protein
MVLFQLNVQAQYYMRTKKNVGIVSMYNFGKEDRLAPSIQFGLCKQFGRYTIPELGFKAQSNNGAMEPFSLYTGIQFRKNLIKLNTRKKGAKCMAELLEGFVTPEFQYVLPNTNIQTQAPFSIRYGLGIYHAESGGSRRSRTWETKVEVYHRNFLGGPTANQQEFGVALRIQHFKSYDFLK